MADDSNLRAVVAQFLTLSEEDKRRFWSETVRHAVTAFAICTSMPPEEEAKFRYGYFLQTQKDLADIIISAVQDLIEDHSEGPVYSTHEASDAAFRHRYGWGASHVHARVAEALNRQERAIRREEKKKRAPKPRMGERNYIVHYLLTEKGLRWEVENKEELDVMKYLKEFYPLYAPEELKTVRNQYYSWRNKAGSLTDYAAWRKENTPL